MGSLQGEVMQKGGDNTKENTIYVLDRDYFGFLVIFEDVKWA